MEPPEALVKIAEKSLIQVFATWAQPALLEVPLLQSLETQYGKDRLAIVQIALDPTGLYPRTQTFGVNWVGMTRDSDLFISSDGPLGEINTVPSSFLLDRRGRIIKAGRTLGPRKFEVDPVRLACSGSTH